MLITKGNDFPKETRSEFVAGSMCLYTSLNEKNGYNFSVSNEMHEREQGFIDSSPEICGLAFWAIEHFPHLRCPQEPH